MDFWRSVGGMVAVQLTSADLEHLLKKLNENHVTLYDLEFTDELICRLCIKREDFRRTQQICKSMGVDLETRSKNGLYWIGKQLLLRPVFFCGFLLLMVFVLIIPTRVFFLRVEGNEEIPANQILEAAADCGIRFGATRRQVRSEKVKNALLGALPQLQWAGVNTNGCVATISVKERAAVQQQREKSLFSSIVAVRDGYVLDATATRGALMVQPGQTVTSGQILISGYIDLGSMTQITAPEGEICAQTQRNLEVITPSYQLTQRKTGSEKKKYSLLVGKKRINLWNDSGISGATCGRMYEECYVTLPGNFVLPLAFCRETYIDYALEASLWENAEPDADMENYADNYMRHQMVAGEILQSETQWHQKNGIYTLTKQCICKEMIGRVRQEQIGDIHE